MPYVKSAFGGAKHSTYLCGDRDLLLNACRYLKQTARMLKDDFDSDVPKTVDELCSLPGVGPKMAFLALHSAWNLSVTLS